MSDLLEPIGISLDLANDRLYYGQAGNSLSSIPGTVPEATLDGTEPRAVGRGN